MKESVKISWYGKHFGEEPPFVGTKYQGAGGIFFTGCHLRCCFCQNYQISQEKVGKEYSIKRLADIMLALQKQNAMNIDLVTPTIWWQQIKQAIILAKKQGLTIPVIWNSNGYELEKIILAMQGLVDIYLPDFKYGLEEIGYKYSGVHQYPSIAQKAIKAMIKQVDINNVVVRHMVLPNNLSNSLEAINLLSEIDKNIQVSIMNQYYPLYQAKKFPEINQQVSQEEWEKVLDYLNFLNLQNGWVQEKNSATQYLPDFTKSDPFGII